MNQKIFLRSIMLDKYDPVSLASEIICQGVDPLDDTIGIESWTLAGKGADLHIDY
jgi:hypothetical protein